MQKIVVIGANGQLGSDLVKVLQDENIDLIALSRKDLDVTNKINVDQLFTRLKPDIVINTAAYHRVDEIESNSELAFMTNAVANQYLANISVMLDFTLIYISTDYVFGEDKQRKKPYTEQDCPGPVNIYGVSKLAGEQLIRSVCKKYFIVRTAALFGNSGSGGKGGNFVETIIKLAKLQAELKVVNDQVTTPTSTLKLSQQIVELIKTFDYGIYHATAEGSCSWFEFAVEILKLCKIKKNIIPISSAESSAVAKRPHYSVLENEKLKKMKINQMSHWKAGLGQYLKLRGYISS